MSHSEKRDIWFVYDGECPMCRSAALALRIKRDYGNLHLINARDSEAHALVLKINQRRIDLDKGMVIHDGDRFYHGKDALRFIAHYGDTKGFFNLANKIIFRSKTIVAIIYPWLRGIRNLLLRSRKIKCIDNLCPRDEPIFKAVFGDSWNNLPPVMRRHYANRPYSNDRTTVEGTLDVMCAGAIKWLSPLLWSLGTVPPHNEIRVPVTVHFESDKNSKAFHFNRLFSFKQRKPYRFHSRMLSIGNNELIEIMRFGVSWRFQCLWQDDRVKLKHRGYMLHWFGHFIPLPLTWLLGEGNAEETPIDDDSFSMWVRITHSWWGKLYEYKGQFSVVTEI